MNKFPLHLLPDLYGEAWLDTKHKILDLQSIDLLGLVGVEYYIDKINAFLSKETTMLGDLIETSIDVGDFQIGEIVVHALLLVYVNKSGTVSD